MKRRAPKCDCGCGQQPAKTTRLRKAECRSCGYIIRLSRDCISRGLPSCPCGATLEPPCLHDACAAPGELGAAAYSELCARDDEFARRSEQHAKRALGQMRCPDCKGFRPFASNCDPTDITPCTGRKGACASVKPAIFIPRAPKLAALSPAMPF